MINKPRNLNLFPHLCDAHLSFAPEYSRVRRKSKHDKFLLPYGTVYIKNTLPMVVVFLQHIFIRELEHGIFHVDNNDHKFFERSIDLHKAPTKNLFQLRLECKGKPKMTVIIV